MAAAVKLARSSVSASVMIGDGPMSKVSVTPVGADAANVRRAFRQMAEDAGLQGEDWTPRELRHSFVSLLSSAGIPIEDIAHLVGHANTRTTEKLYRKELRPVLRHGAKAMDDLFNAHRAASEPPLCPPPPVRTKRRLK